VGREDALQVIQLAMYVTNDDKSASGNLNVDNVWEVFQLPPGSICNLLSFIICG
jgi:hypothetical protein